MELCVKMKKNVRGIDDEVSDYVRVNWKKSGDYWWWEGSTS